MITFVQRDNRPKTGRRTDFLTQSEHSRGDVAGSHQSTRVDLIILIDKQHWLEERTYFECQSCLKFSCASAPHYDDFITRASLVIAGGLCCLEHLMES
jgi:hypothetical protein